jgi:hypothetical protein
MGGEKGYGGEEGYVPPVALKLGASFAKTADAATPVALSATSSRCLMVLVQPAMDDTGAPSNSKIVELRAAGAAVGIKIRPESDGILLPIGDLADVMLKTYVNGEGVVVTPLVDPAA